MICLLLYASVRSIKKLLPSTTIPELGSDLSTKIGPAFVIVLSSAWFVTFSSTKYGWLVYQVQNDNNLVQQAKVFFSRDPFTEKERKLFANFAKFLEKQRHCFNLWTEGKTKKIKSITKLYFVYYLKLSVTCFSLILKKKSTKLEEDQHIESSEQIHQLTSKSKSTYVNSEITGPRTSHS